MLLKYDQNINSRTFSKVFIENGGTDGEKLSSETTEKVGVIA